MTAPDRPLANDLLKNLPPDSWYRVTGTPMRAVCPPDSLFPEVQGTSGCRMVMEAWSGAAYDPLGKRLIVWGGGHSDYYGNELYAFDVERLRWERITEPSPPARLSQDPLPDGTPISRHTYDGLAFITHANRFFGYGGSMAGNGYGTRNTWTWDAAQRKWTDMRPAGSANGPDANCCNFSGDYDPVSRKIFLRDPHWLCAYDFDANAWTHVQELEHDWGPGKGVVVPGRRLFFTVGMDEFLAYDIDRNRDVTEDWKTTGPDSVIRAYGPGAAYDSRADALVGWIGGGPYALDLATKAWTRKSGTGAPAKPLGNGTFGRFRYIEEDNVFILANGIDSDVYFYKHTAGAGSPLRPAPAHRRHRTPSVSLDGARVVFHRGGTGTDARGRRADFGQSHGGLK